MRSWRSLCSLGAVAASLFAGGSVEVQADEAARDERPITRADRKHWAFQPLADPPVPDVVAADWPRNPIDRFVLARLEAAGLSPSWPADRVTLIRRVTFDLTGLPPAPEEVDAFLADERPDAYERVVDRLLASTAYGERWAQHWLDLARFAETDGFEHDHVRPHAWKYRDWVIEALNADMPYDEFVQLQIAGDLLRPGDESAAVATGFALCGPDMTDINLVAERRHMVLNDITATAGSVFLGLQLGCAECHDHKYDPLSQADFYRLRAYFESALQFDNHQFGRVLFESRLGAHTGGVGISPEHISLEIADPPETFLYERGDFRRPGPRVEPAVPRIARVAGEPCPVDDDAFPRAALARALTRPGNFLSTRVIVNRLWQHHFGHGLVRTPSDFGTMGEEPSHPELLDWLARELPRRGWSLKEMHRLMVTSATYRQASHLSGQGESVRQAWDRAAEYDPENRLLWRANRQRLAGEAIRDAMLAAAGRLSDRRGGPGAMPPLPEELVVTLLKNQWQPSEDEEDHRRRSIYLFVRRNLPYPMFAVFDRPDTNASCPRRAQSTIAPQSLLLLNSEFSLGCARDLAAYMLQHAEDDPACCVDLAYRRTLSRRPTADERKRAVAFLAAMVENRRDADPDLEPFPLDSFPAGTDLHSAAALTHLCLGLFNLNEFVYVD